MWVFAIIALLTLVYPMFFLHELYGRDWRYFDGLSLFVKSSFLGYRNHGGPLLPLQDPWCGGGLNVLANPQNRIFSPFLLLDLALPIYWANLIGLLIYAFFGVWGMYRLMREFQIARPASLLTALLFINGSFFGTHYAEGHIPFGSMQLLPWVLWAFLRIERKGAMLLLTALLSLFLLDGGMYCFIFSLLLIASACLVGLKKPLDVFCAITRAPFYFAGCCVAMILTAIPKLAPVLIELRGRAPNLDFFQLPLKTVLVSLFWPAQRLIFPTPGTIMNFQEFGCYLGVIPTIILIVRWVREPALLKKDWKFLVLIAFWFWVATGWLAPINPWHLFHKLPIINNAHVQSRVFLLMFIFFLILLGRELGRKNLSKKSVLILFGFLAIESVFVRNFPFAVHKKEPATQVRSLIESDNLVQTVQHVEKPWIYLERDKSSLECYEPATPFPTQVAFFGSPAYHGEIYIKHGNGNAFLKSYVPGQIKFATSGPEPKAVVLNTNDLGHWRVESGIAKIVSSKGDLLKLVVSQGDQEITLRFMPWYWTYCLVSFAAGIALFIFLGNQLAQPIFKRH